MDGILLFLCTSSIFYIEFWILWKIHCRNRDSFISFWRIIIHLSFSSYISWLNYLYSSSKLLYFLWYATTVIIVLAPTGVLWDCLGISGISEEFRESLYTYFEAPFLWLCFSQYCLHFPAAVVALSSALAFFKTVKKETVKLWVPFSFLKKNYFIVVQLQLSSFTPHNSPRCQLNPPLSLASTPTLVLSMCPL